MLVQSPNQVLFQKNEEKLQMIFNWLDTQERILSARTVEEDDFECDEIILLPRNERTFPFKPKTSNEFRTRGSSVGTQTVQEEDPDRKEILIRAIRQKFLQIINNFETVPARTVRDEVPARTVEDRESKERMGLSQMLLPDSTSNHESCAPLAQYGQTSEDKGLEQNQKQIILEIHQKLLEIIKKMTTGGNVGGSETEQKEDSVQTVPDDIFKQREAVLAEGFPVQVRDSLQTAMARRSAEDGKARQDAEFELAKGFPVQVQDSLQTIMVRRSVEDGKAIQDEGFELAKGFPVQVRDSLQTAMARRSAEDGKARQDAEFELAKGFPVQVQDSLQTIMVRRSVEDGKAIQDEGFELAEDILDEVQDSLQIIIVRGSVEDGQSIQDENFEQKEDYQVKGMPFNDREISHSMTIGRGVKESCSCVETQGSVQGAQTVQNDVPDANKTPLGIVEVGKLDVSRAERKTPIGLDKDLNQVLKACDSTYLRTNITTLINLVNKMPYNNDTEMFLTHSDWRGQSEMKFVCIVIRKYMIGSLEASDYIIFTHLYKRIVPAVPDCLVLLSGLLPHSEEFTDTTISYELKELVETAFVWKILKSGYLKIENKRLYIK